MRQAPSKRQDKDMTGSPMGVDGRMLEEAREMPKLSYNPPYATVVREMGKG